MKKWLLLLIVFPLFFSCELHEQTNVVAGKKEARVVNLSVIEELTSALLQNDIREVEKVMEGGNYDINVPNKEGELLLNKAVASHRFSIGSLLLRYGADPTLNDEQNNSAVKLIKTSPYQEDWQRLINDQKITEKTANELVFKFIKDARPSNSDKFERLIKNTIELGASLTATNSGQFTYLMESASAGLTTFIELFCEYPETDPNVKVERGRGRRKRVFTALKLAKNDETRKALYACGAVDQD